MCYTKCKEKHEKRAKALHLEAGMYRYSNGQISLSDFKQPRLVLSRTKVDFKVLITLKKYLMVRDKYDIMSKI